MCKAVAAAALVAIGLRDPVADRLRRWLKLFRQVFRRAAGTNQFDHLPPELRRVWGAFLRHCGLLKHKCFGVHESGGTSLITSRMRLAATCVYRAVVSNFACPKSTWITRTSVWLSNKCV